MAPPMSLGMACVRPSSAIIGCLHLTQALVVRVLGNALALPLAASHLVGEPASNVLRRTVAHFHVCFGIAVALVSLLSGLARFCTSGRGWTRSTRWLGPERNPSLLPEYSVSASAMIILIATFTSIDDVAALLLSLLGIDASMIGFG
jgi:hypothetical protein